MAETAYVPRLRTQFDKEIRSKLTEQFGYANPMQVPTLTKVVLNMGIGEAVNDRKKVELAAADLALIAGKSTSGLGRTLYPWRDDGKVTLRPPRHPSSSVPRGSSQNRQPSQPPRSPTSKRRAPRRSPSP